jgi:putative NIF3 family GTP cyclohydrolase 1 type 2
VGRKGQREDVSEWRLEVVVPEERVSAAIAAMRKAHSYEEPAFDVYPLKPSKFTGEGRVGDLPEAVPLSDIVSQVRQKLRTDGVSVVGSLNRPVRRIAVACGAAGEFLNDAIRAKADLFLTGEMRFHDLLAAEAAGISVVLPGHYATERPGIEDLAILLGNQFAAASVGPSRRERDPLRIVM